MRPFIGTDDLGAVLGSPVSDLDLITAIALDSGSEAVRSYIQQTINFVKDDVEEIDGSGRKTVRLHERPVRYLTSVMVNDILIDPSILNLRGSLLRLTNGTVFNQGIANVVVTYDHGWDIIPDNSAGDDLLVPADLRLVALLSARRVYTAVGTVEGSPASETIGKYSYSLTQTAVAKSAAELMEPEERVLDRYKIGLVP